MSPQLATDSRSFLEYIDDMIARQPKFIRIPAEKDAHAYDRERDLGRSFTLVPLHKYQIEDDSVSGCLQVITKIAAKLIASETDHWANHDYNKPIALLGFLIAERNRLRELVTKQNAEGMARIFVEAAA